MNINQMKPKIGLLLLTAEWFTQIGATQGTFAALPERLAADATAIEAALGAEMDVVNPGVLDDVDGVRRAVALFREREIEGIVACQITWGEDRLLLEAVRLMGDLPLLLWCYSPHLYLPARMSMVELFRSSGPVGILQASGPLKRLGRKFAFAFGSYANPETIGGIAAFARAARLAGRLRSVRIGVLPYRCDLMTGTYIDEFRLRHELGPELRYLSVHEYQSFCEQIPGAEVDAFVADLRARYKVAPAVTEAGLSKGARASLGLALLAERHTLDALAIDDGNGELHRLFGLRPCLYVPALFARAVVSMEADLGGAVAMLALRELAGKAPMYAEIFTYDKEENVLLMGHAGIHDVAGLVDGAAEILLEPDGEYAESEPDSAWMSFRARGGRVTMLSVFCDRDRFKLIASHGEALQGPRVLLGSPHIVVRAATPLPEFFVRAVRTGMTQHWAVAHAQVLPELAMLAEILGAEMVVI